MSTFSRWRTFFFLIPAALILTQCTETKSEDFVKQGHTFTQQEKYDKAVESYLKAIQKRPNNPEAYYGLGGIYNYKEMHLDAEQAFLAAVQLDPTHFNAIYSLAFTYEKLGRKDEAEKYFEKYRELKKKYDDIVEKDADKQ